MTQAYIEGPPYQKPENLPISMAAYIHALIRLHPQGEYVEINQLGKTTIQPYRIVYQRALDIAAEIERQMPLHRPAYAIICLDSALDFIAAAWACLFSGVHCVPWPIQSATRNATEFIKEIETLLQKFKHPLILTEHSIQTLLTHSPHHPFSIIDIHALATGSEPDLKAPTANPHDLHPSDFLISTSGTTGQPKLAILDNRTVLNRFFSGLNPDPTGVALYCLPHHTITGLWLLIPVHKQIVFFQPWRLMTHTVELLAVIERYRVTRFGLSSFFAALINEAIAKNQPHYDLSSLTSLGLGAETIVPSVVATLIRNFHRLGMQNALISLIYGMTEAGPIACWQLSSSELLQRIGEGHQPLSIDGCVQGWSLRIVDDNGHLLNHGQMGRIEIRSHHKLFAGYYNEPVLNQAGFTGDGWFYTGDLGQVDEGKIQIFGREQATVIINARKITCEQIEAPLRELDGLSLKTVIAAPYRDTESVTDELAIFFAPESLNETALSSLSSRIVGVIAHKFGISVKHLIAVPEAEFIRTSTGKIQRRAMIKCYRKNRWKTLVMPPKLTVQTQDSKLTLDLRQLWQEALQLMDLPSAHDDFFELGGDSLAAARLIARIENTYKIELPLGRFFQAPTISNMSELMAECQPISIRQNMPTSLTREVAIYSKSWRGTRLFEDSLIVGRNTAGKKPPLFWVFQSNDEFQALAEHLGLEQPLYGLRSCVEIIPPRHYQLDTLQPLIDRYLWEIIALTDKQSFRIGGNCQGAIVALLLSQHLKQVNRAPDLLILMEWSFCYGGYTDPVLLIYGAESHTAEWYTGLATDNYAWRSDFPNHVLSSTPGAHGQFWDKANIEGLAAVIKGNLLTTDTKQN